MNFHNTTQAYARPVPKLSLRNYFRPVDFTLLMRKTAPLIKRSGKIMLLISTLVAILNFAVISAIGSIESSIINLENARHTLIDKNIEYRAGLANLNNPLNLSRLAQDKLSLDIPSKEQVRVYDPRQGNFRQGQFDRKTKTFVYF